MKVLIKGAGDLATGVAAELFKAGYRIIMTEIPVPLTVRRQVAFSRAVYEGQAVVEGITGRLAADYDEAVQILDQGMIAVIVDPEAKIASEYHPDVIIDAILAKRNTGTRKEDAPCVIALGPGFTAGEDCYAVVETMRGTTLGEPVYEGHAIPNTGIPGLVGGYGIERLIKAAADGTMKAVAQIGDVVKKGQLLAMTGREPVYAQIDGIIRGMLQDGVSVTEGMKIGDVDPRKDIALVRLISDKSRKIGQGVKKAIHCYYYGQFGIVLLAAGLSKRYGSNKMLTRIEGKEMYAHILEKTDAFKDCKRVIVSRFDEVKEAAQKHQLCYVANDHPEEGITSSLRLGLQALLDQEPNLQGVLFLVCDQPYLTEASLEKMMERAADSPDKIVVAAFKERRGNPVYFGKTYFKDLLRLSGDVGGKQLLKRYPQDVILCQIPEKELKDIDKNNSE